MATLLTIEFTPCPASQNAVYQVRYRRSGGQSYTLYPGTFSTSPALISLPDDVVTQQYEGYIDPICNGVPGPSSYWRTGDIVAKAGPAAISFDLPAGSSFAGNASIKGTSTFRAATIDWGDDSEPLVIEGKENSENKFILSHAYSDAAQAHTVIIAFENNTDLLEVLVSGDKVTSISGLNSQNQLNTIGFFDTGLTDIIGLPPSVKDIDLRDNHLTSKIVNGVLASLVEGRQAGGVLYVSGQTPEAPPTGQGVVDMEILISRGWTVVTDLVP